MQIFVISKETFNNFKQNYGLSQSERENLLARLSTFSLVTNRRQVVFLEQLHDGRTIMLVPEKMSDVSTILNDRRYTHKNFQEIYAWRTLSPTDLVPFLNPPTTQTSSSSTSSSKESKTKTHSYPLSTSTDHRITPKEVTDLLEFLTREQSKLAVSILTSTTIGSFPKPVAEIVGEYLHTDNPTPNNDRSLTPSSS